VVGGYAVGFHARASRDGVAVSVIGKEDLIAIKRASGRPQDLLDVEALVEMGEEQS